MQADGESLELQLLRRLREIDDTTAAEIAAREAQMRKETAAQEAAERRTQAAAVARAPRGP